MPVTVAQAVERVCYYANLRALIVLPEHVRQQELALTLAPVLRFHVRGAEELLEHDVAQDEKRGLIVWGYHPAPTQLR